MSEIKEYWEQFKQASRKLKAQLYLGYGITFAVLSIPISRVLLLGVKQLMMDQIGQSRLDVLKQISERSNTIKNSTITISNLYRYDEEVQRCLDENGLSEEEMEQAGRYLDGVKENYDRVFHDVGVAYDVVILGDNGFRYASRGRDHYDFDGLESQLWYKRSYDAENDIVFISSFREKFDLSSREARYVFAAFRRVAGADGGETGTILVNVDEKYLEDLYGTAEDRSNLYIFDKKGNIVSSREKSLLGKNFIGVDNFRRLYGENEYHIIKKLGQDYLLSNYYDPQTGWTIVEEMPCAVILQPLNQALVLLLVIVSGCLLAGTGAACYMSERISKPIRKLCRLMDRVKQGDFDVISDIRGYEEVNQLKDSFNEMAAEIKKLLEDIRDNEMQKRKSEMDFLRAQINPHFLYNTLFSIQCMIELKKNDQAVLMMAAFTDLLKKTLSVDTDFITLKEEFESTEKYLVLQQIRYGDKIHYECEMGAETEQCLVPALIIQPIVENAIFHGIEAKEEAGLIIVESVVSEGVLLITVSDDGVGLDGKELARMTAQFGEREYQSGRSIGILNVLNRIKINFGEEYGLTVESEPGIGTSVTMRLPAVLKEMQGVNYENTDSR